MGRSMKRLFICLTILLFSANCLADPSVSGHTGEASNGATVTISGSDFGSMDGSIISWDNFEAHSIGAQINGSSPVIGVNWSAMASDSNYTGMVYANEHVNSGSVAASIDWSIPNEKNISAFGWASQGPYTQLYITYWRYMTGDYSSNIEECHTGDGYSCNYKQFYLYGNSGQMPQGMPLIPAGTNSWGFYNNDGDQIMKWDWTWFQTRNKYNRWEFWTKLNEPYTSSNGEIKVWLNAEKGIDSNTYQHRDVNGAYIDFRLGHMSQGFGDSAKVWLDDLYIATTQARVELGNASTWTACTHREIQIPTSWSDTSIQTTMNHGGFHYDDTAYIYVVDSNGVYNASGSPVSLSGVDTSPPSITSILPTNGSSTETASQTLSANVNDSSGVVNVRYSTSDISYASMGSGGDMSQSGSTWTKGVTLSLGSNTYYIAAIDTLDNVTTSNASTTVTLTEGGDTTAPEVTAFVIPTGSSSLTFPVTTFTATDAVGVTGYLITESATPPSAGDVGWSASVPSSYTAESDGAHTLYAWAKDAGSNISDSLNDSVTITISSLPGGVTDFSPTGDTSLNVNTTNYSTDTNLKVYSWPSNEPSNTAILVFDTSAYSAQGVIHSATLKLFVEESGGDAAMNVAVARLNVDPVVAQATGEVYAAGSDWTSPSPRQTAPFSELGLMNIAAPSDIVSIEAALGQYKNFDVTSIVQKAVAENDPTFAILVYPHGDMSSDTYRFFSSQDHATAEQRPVLTVTFQHAGGNSASGGEVR